MSFQVIVRGKNMEVTEALRDHVIRKLSKLGRHFEHEPVTAEALLWVEKDRQIIEVTLPLEGGRLLRGEEETPDMYASVDLVVDKLERQLNKLKSRVRPRAHAGPERTGVAAEPDGTLVRRKTFPAKPMAVDEAILQMEMLGHDFFAFANAESEQINVVYRRKDGNYGLLEPR
jgi:putative sigma-54 modulation protein